VNNLPPHNCFNLERLRVPEKQLLVTPAMEAQLNQRQKKYCSRPLKLVP
jgi:hypothetical protein